MFLLQKEFRFEAGHQLDHHDGRCKNPHGHSYVLIVSIKSMDLIKCGPKTNMVTDFSDISSVVKPMIQLYLDHHWLNDTLKTDSPTAEYIAKWIYDFLSGKITNLYSITLSETETSKVVYSRNSDFNE